MELIDTHCHLTFDPLKSDLQGVIERADQCRVTRIIAPAYDLASWKDLASLTRFPNIYTAIGLHPWKADEPFDIDTLAQRARELKAVAIGEIGLDSKVEVSQSRQMKVFEKQLDAADHLDLPVLLHVRGAFEGMLEILTRRCPKKHGVIHAFSRGPELAGRFVDLGFYIAFGGAITRERARRAKRAAATVPAERLLLETDAPSIGLEGVPKEAVEPKHVSDISKALAAIRGTTPQEIAKRTTQNAITLFNL